MVLGSQTYCIQVRFFFECQLPLTVKVYLPAFDHLPSKFNPHGGSGVLFLPSPDTAGSSAAGTSAGSRRSDLGGAH